MKKVLLLLTAGLMSLAVIAQPSQPDKGMKGKRDVRVERISRDSLAMQRHQERQEQIQSRKAAYFTAKLGLTPDEAQAFWPVYNEYWQKRDKLFMERNNIMHKIQRDKVDDKKAQQITQRILENELEDANLLREYNERFAKVLPPQKLLKYYAAEESFKMELINDLRKQERGKKE